MRTNQKRDIVEVAEELGVDLAYHDGYGKPYYTGFCPMHDNTHTPAFAVYPLVQRFYCYACCPEGGDVIDLVRKVLGIGFAEAMEKATRPMAPAEAMSQGLRDFKVPVDEALLQARASRMHDEPRHIDFYTGQRVFEEFDRMVEEQRWSEADRLLRRVGL